MTERIRILRDSYLAVERAAVAQAFAELEVLDKQPLTVGEHVAWVTTAHMGTTDGLSAVHRVAVGEGEKLETFCGEVIPDAKCRLTLTPALIRTQPRCKWCEQGYARATARRQEGVA